MSIFHRDPEHTLNKFIHKIHNQEKSEKQIIKLCKYILKKKNHFSPHKILTELHYISEKIGIEVKQGKLVIKQEKELPEDLRKQFESFLQEEAFMSYLQKMRKQLDEDLDALEPKLKSLHENFSEDRKPGIIFTEEERYVWELVSRIDSTLIKFIQIEDAQRKKKERLLNSHKEYARKIWDAGLKKSPPGMGAGLYFS